MYRAQNLEQIERMTWAFSMWLKRSRMTECESLVALHLGVLLLMK